MKLTVFNGSPRGEGSNTRILLKHFINGFMTIEWNTYELAYLNRVKDADRFLRLFQEAEHVLLAFPLYSSAMPPMVMTFIESLEPLCGREDNPDIGFIVQGALPESTNSRYLERYLEKLAMRLRCRYKGTVIKGGVEAIRSSPAWMNMRLFKSFFELGRTFGQTGEFDDRIVRKLAKPERLAKLQFRLFNFLANRAYWNPMLRKNNAFHQRFAIPYAK